MPFTALRCFKKACFFTETIEQTIALQTEIGSTIVTGRLVGGLVLVHLAREDPVAANKKFHELEGQVKVIALKSTAILVVSLTDCGQCFISSCSNSPSLA